MAAPEVFKNGLLRMMGALLSLLVSITMKSAGAYKVPTRTQRFFNIPFGKLSVRSASLGIMLTLEPKSQSASRKSTMPMEIGMTGRPGSPL